MDKDGKLKIVGKDEVREAIGRSPDTADTFIVRMYFELLKDATGGTYEQSVSAINRRLHERSNSAGCDTVTLNLHERNLRRNTLDYTRDETSGA